MTDNAIAIRNPMSEPQRAIIQAMYDFKAMVHEARYGNGVQAPILRMGEDYGYLTGKKTRDDEKPILKLPGMEKLMRMLKAVPDYPVTFAIRDYEKGIFHFEYECVLRDVETGMIIPGGRGVGMCTSYEKAFRYRDAKRVCPNCGKETVNKSKNPSEGYYCWKKLDGCGATFGENDPRIADQVVGKVINEDPAEQCNAIMKRAKKRALADAIKGAACVSEYFTVDLEDGAPETSNIRPDYQPESHNAPATTGTPGEFANTDLGLDSDGRSYLFTLAKDQKGFKPPQVMEKLGRKGGKLDGIGFLDAVQTLGLNLPGSNEVIGEVVESDPLPFG